MRTLVIGGTGFLGRHVVASLRRRGHEVTVLSRSGGDVRADVTRDDLTEIVAGHDSLVFAAGADERAPSKDPAFYQKGNVEPVVRLIEAGRKSGLRNVVVHGSYFATFHRERGTEAGAYVQSRLDQAREAHRTAGDEISVAVLEIPFVLGSGSVFGPMLPWLRSRWPLVATRGGTAVVSAETIGEATANALEFGRNGDFPVAEANLTWFELFGRLGEAAGRPAPVRVRKVPSVLVRGGLRAAEILGRDVGIPRMMLSDLFLDLAVCRDALGVTTSGIDRAFADTVTVRKG